MRNINIELNIIFVCYNCASDIIRAIDDIKNGEYPLSKIHVYIVDNASEDESVSMLNSISEISYTIIESELNLGFGGGCNLAIEEIQKGSKTLFLNPDIRLVENSISNLMSFSNRTPDAHIWGGKTLDINGNEDGKNAWKEPSLFGIFTWSFFLDIVLRNFGISSPDSYTKKELTLSDKVDSISGCFLLIDTSLLKHINGFDNRFFMYSEEIDLCRRARQEGASPRTTEKAYIIHEGSKTLNSKNKTKFLYHSKLLYAEKHWGKKRFLLARVFIFMGSILRYFIYSILSIFNRKNKKQTDIWASLIKNQMKWKF